MHTKYYIFYILNSVNGFESLFFNACQYNCFKPAIKSQGKFSD